MGQVCGTSAEKPPPPGHKQIPDDFLRTASPIIGNLDMFLKWNVGQYEDIHKVHPRFAEISLPGWLLREMGVGSAKRAFVLAEPKLIQQVYMQEDVFGKWELKQASSIRALMGDSVFTADDDEKVWGIGHRIMRGAFSLGALKNYFETMQACDSLFRDYLESRGSREPVDLYDQMGRLQFEVIGRCMYGIPVKAWSEPPHAILSTYFKLVSLQEEGEGLSGVAGALNQAMQLREIASASKDLLSWVEKIRHEATSGKAPDEHVVKPERTMLDLMLHEKDPETGEGLQDENIKYQMMSFLFAGLATTQIAKTNILYWIATRPDVEEKLFEEIQVHTGGGPITWENLSKMEYLTQILKENLRLSGLGHVFKATKVGASLGEYWVPADSALIVNIRAVQHDAEIYTDPEKFDPERWTQENEAKREPYTWFPYSAGRRICMGMQFNIISTRLTIASMVQKFHLRVDPSSRCRQRGGQLLSWRDVQMLFVPRMSHEPSRQPHYVARRNPLSALEGAFVKSQVAAGKRMLVLFASNTGTCEELAETLKKRAQALGFDTDMATMNQFVGPSPPVVPRAGEGLVAIVCSSYNGYAPDNGLKFEEAMKSSSNAFKTMEGVHFSMFGVGNRQWRETFQQFPNSVAQTLSGAGGIVVGEQGSGDMDRGQVDAEFSEWCAHTLVSALQALGLSVPAGVEARLRPLPPTYTFYLGGARADDAAPASDTVSIVAPGMQQLDARLSATARFLAANGEFIANISENRELQDSGTGRSTRHVVVDLPQGVTYATGDHLGVLMPNPDDVVLAYLDYLQVSADAVVILDTKDPPPKRFPLGQPVSAFTLFAYFVELQQVATKEQIRVFAHFASSEEQVRLRDLVSRGEYLGSVEKPRKTVLEILREFPTIKVNPGVLLGCLPVMKPRYYSISSSPTKSPRQISITVSVVQGASPTGREHKGVCSHGLSQQPRAFPGSVYSDAHAMPFTCFVKDTGSSFRLPPLATDVIMIGSGSGVAPFRGFIEERQGQTGAGRTVLFFGCRDESDFLYRTEFEGWQKSGALELHVAFSRKSGQPKTYVQHLVMQQADQLEPLLVGGAHVFVCGDASKMAPGVRAVLVQMAGLDMVEKMELEGRYKADVWASQSL